MATATAAAEDLNERPLDRALLPGSDRNRLVYSKAIVCMSLAGDSDNAPHRSTG